jgi:threonine/homoserine/homoserine lactone efflux protein
MDSPSGGTIGFTSLLLFIGFGFYNVIDLYPLLLKYLTVAGSLFIVYMGYLIASSKPELAIEKQNRPTFMQGLLLQWLNPKAWIACMVGVSSFSVPNDNKVFLTFSFIYFIVCYLSLLSWSVLGEKVTILLNSPLKLRIFNQLMGGVLILTGGFLLYSQLK